MKAKSIKGRTRDEIQIALRQSMNDGFKPTLAIVFLSVSQDRKAVCKVLSDAGIKIFGATTNGEFIDECGRCQWPVCSRMLSWGGR